MVHGRPGPIQSSFSRTCPSRSEFMRSILHAVASDGETLVNAKYLKALCLKLAEFALALGRTRLLQACVIYHRSPRCAGPLALAYRRLYQAVHALLQVDLQ